MNQREVHDESFEDRDVAIATAHRLNQDHSNSCCEAKWMIERWDNMFNVVRYHLDTPATIQI